MASDASNIVRATLACGTVNPFTSCNTVAGDGVGSISGVTLGAAKSPKVCFEFDREIAGITYSQCVSVDIGAGTNGQTNSEPFCYNETTSGHCGTIPLGATCVINPANLECAADADCPAVSGTTAKCVSATAGTCKTTDATCQ